MEETQELIHLIPPPPASPSPVSEVKIGHFYASLKHDEVLPAFVDATNEIESAIKDSTNPHLKNKYADLSSCLSVVKPALKGNSLTLIQPPSLAEDMKSVTIGNMIMHKSGQYIRWDFVMPFSGPLSPHEVGKSITYARRYSLSGVGIMTDEDDDGNSGSNVTGPPNRGYDNRQPARPEPPAPKKAEPKKVEAKAEAKKPEQAAAAPTTELGQFLAQQEESAPNQDLDDIIQRICKANNGVQPQAVHRFLETSEINKEPMELQLRFMNSYANDRTFSAVATNWKRTGKTFLECYEEALKETPDKWRENLKAKAA